MSDIQRGDLVRQRGPADPRCYGRVEALLPGEGASVSWTFDGGKAWVEPVTINLEHIQPLEADGAPDYCKRPEWANTTTPANHPRPGIALAHLMSEISERCYYAGWLIGIEEILWEVAAEVRDHDRGQDTVLEFEVHWLRALAVAAGGWIAWLDGDGPNLDGGIGPGPRLVAWDGSNLGTMGCRLRPAGERTWCGKVPLVPQGTPADGEHCDACDERLAFVVADIVAVGESR